MASGYVGAIACVVKLSIRVYDLGAEIEVVVSGVSLCVWSTFRKFVHNVSVLVLFYAVWSFHKFIDL